MPNGTEDSVDTAVDELLAAGTRVGAYSITRRIGSGGMAVVYAAQHVSLGKRVAIKVLQRSHANRSEVARRFKREGEAAARLSHPNVVEVFDVGVGQDGLGPYLVMEFLDGEDLSRYLRRRGCLSVQEIADLMVPVLSGVAAAHAAGVVHRDLKPENIFLCQQRGGVVPKVVDFGVSKFDENLPASSPLTQSRVLLGTPSYMSPEQARGARRIDARTDQFSLGVILYECATGKRPFDGESLYSILTAIVEQPPERLSKSTPLDPEFERLVGRALSKRPDDRFSSVREFGRGLLQFASSRTKLNYAADFDELAQDSGSTPGSVGRLPLDSAPSVPTTSRRRLAGALSAAAIAIAAVAGATLSLRSHEPIASAPVPSPSKLGEQAQRPPAAVDPAQAISTTSARSLQVVVDPPTAQISLDGIAVAIGSYSAELLSDGRPHQLSASAPGYDDWSVRFDLELPPQHVVLKRSTLRVRPASMFGSRAEPPASTAPTAPRARPSPARPPAPAVLARPAPTPRVVEAGGPAREPNLEPSKQPAARTPLIEPGGSIPPKQRVPSSIDTSDPYTN